MPWQDLPHWKPDDILKAEDLNRLVDVIRRITITVSQSSGLDMLEGPGGTSLRVRWRQDRYLAYTSGGITARSGSTPGTGSAAIQTYDPVNGITSTGIDVDVLNWNDATGGVGTGKYLWVVQDNNGFWWVWVAEC